MVIHLKFTIDHVSLQIEGDKPKLELGKGAVVKRVGEILISSIETTS